MKPARRRVWWVLAGILAGAYALLVVMAATTVDGALFHPEVKPGRRSERLQSIPWRGDQRLAMLWLPNPKARSTLWYFHGNAETLADCEPTLERLRLAGFAVYAVEYPGYSGGPGVPSEATINDAMAAAGGYLRETLGVAPARTILYGRSLGGGPAVRLAAGGGYGGLILESAFTSAFRVVTRWRVLPFDRFDNLDAMRRVTCPVLVMQGTEDRVVPPDHGPALLAAAGGPKRHLWVAGAGHNDVAWLGGAAYWEALTDFRKLCAGPAAR